MPRSLDLHEETSANSFPGSAPSEDSRNNARMVLTESPGYSVFRFCGRLA
jgi:hypothetical protein